MIELVSIRRYNARGRGSRISRGVKTNRRTQLAIYHQILASMNLMISDVEGLADWLENSATPEQAMYSLRELREKWRRIYGNKSESFANRWLQTVSDEQKAAFQKRIAASLGVDFTVIYDDDTVREAAELMTAEATTCIQTIPEKYFDDIQEKVLLNYQQFPLPDGMSLTQYIAHTYHLQDWEAKRLARDQTSKMNTAITRARNEELGIEEYIWRTSGDSRVVGTPGGLYTRPSKLHGNHYERNGKVFRWDSPPYDGHPGWPIQCRCWADPVIVIDKLKNVEYGKAA